MEDWYTLYMRDEPVMFADDIITPTYNYMAIILSHSLLMPAALHRPPGTSKSTIILNYMGLGGKKSSLIKSSREKDTGNSYSSVRGRGFNTELEKYSYCCTE